MPRDHAFNDYRGRRVTVMGLGSFGGGLGAVKFLVERGALVTVTDARPETQLANSLAELQDCPVVRWRLGEHHDDDFRDAELVVINPAVKPNHPLLSVCRSRQIPLTSEMNLFWQHNRGRVLAVTGSNGKSTTTAMLHSILSHTGRRCWLGGNLGRSLLPVVDEIGTDDLVILELSSFQLAGLNSLEVSPHIGIVTNFAPNHLDWHPSLEHYRESKQTLLRWQTATDIAVLNADDPDVHTWPVVGQRLTFGLTDQADAGVYWNGTTAIWRDSGCTTEFPLREWLSLPGRHNLANALAATVAALACGANLSAVQQGIESFQALPHRLQFLGEAAGRRFYNDSLATTPESTLVALDAFTAPIVLLAGGYDKQVDLTALADGIAARTKAVSLMGQTAAALRERVMAFPGCRTLASPCQTDFREAFAWAADQSAPGDIILLSPGCASYDWFRNFSDRGAQFQQLARAWMERQSPIEEAPDTSAGH